MAHRLHSKMMSQLDHAAVLLLLFIAGARLRATAAGSARWQHGHCTRPRARHCSASSGSRVQQAVCTECTAGWCSVLLVESCRVLRQWMRAIGAAVAVDFEGYGALCCTSGCDGFVRHVHPAACALLASSSKGSSRFAPKYMC
jgi:hypothetical protein